jgi:hypothetical protein
VCCMYRHRVGMCAADTASHSEASEIHIDRAESDRKT